ncbi:MAG: hypothetical protein ACQEUI_10350 [Actinomycetota bacterium]
MDLVPAEQLPDDGALEPDRPAPRPDPAGTSVQHLGRFHPTMATQVLALIEERGIEPAVHPHDDHTEVAVPGMWRNDVRAELVLRWDELLAGLEPDDAPAVLATGGHTPGWFDAPLGGHIDRDGKLVVDAPAEDDADGGRTLGPAMIAGGAILVVSGWQIVELPALVLIGIALVVIGLFLPR